MPSPKKKKVVAAKQKQKQKQKQSVNIVNTINVNAKSRPRKKAAAPPQIRIVSPVAQVTPFSAASYPPIPPAPLPMYPWQLPFGSGMAMPSNMPTAMGYPVPQQQPGMGTPIQPPVQQTETGTGSLVSSQDPAIGIPAPNAIRRPPPESVYESARSGNTETGTGSSVSSSDAGDVASIPPAEVVFHPPAEVATHPATSNEYTMPRARSEPGQTPVRRGQQVSGDFVNVPNVPSAPQANVAVLREYYEDLVPAARASPQSRTPQRPAPLSPFPVQYTPSAPTGGPMRPSMLFPGYRGHADDEAQRHHEEFMNRMDAQMQSIHAGAAANTARARALNAAMSANGSP